MKRNFTLAIMKRNKAVKECSSSRIKECNDEIRELARELAHHWSGVSIGYTSYYCEIANANDVDIVELLAY